MNTRIRCRMTNEQGLSLIEVMVALLLTGILMAAVFLLLQKGQNSFNREPEVAEMNQSSRAGLDRISRDLAMAGYQTPAAMAVLWQDGGGIVPEPDAKALRDRGVGAIFTPGAPLEEIIAWVRAHVTPRSLDA